MALIIFIVVSILILFTVVYLYAKSLFQLPANADDLVDEVLANPNKQVVFDKMQFVDLTDTRICYEDIPGKEKNSEVVVLLHGLSQTMLNFPPYFCQSFIDAGFRVVRIDHQGGGGSSWVKDWAKPNKYDLKDMARHATQVMDHLGIGQFHLVGMSMGGMVAQQIAIDLPNRVASLTSIMSTAYMFNPLLTNVPLKFKLGIVYCILAYGRNLKSLKSKLRFKLSTNRMLQGDDSYQYDHKVTLEAAHYEITQKKGYNSRSREQHSYAIKKAGSRIDLLKKLQVPALVIHGTKDPLVLLEHGKQCADLIPNCKALYLEGMGHHLPEAFNEEITGAIIDLVCLSSNQRL